MRFNSLEQALQFSRGRQHSLFQKIKQFNSTHAKFNTPKAFPKLIQQEHVSNQQIDNSQFNPIHSNITHGNKFPQYSLNQGNN